MNKHTTRITELDLLRGCALLGIFLMNIIAMAYPSGAYLNPLAFDSSNWFFSVSERMNLGWRVDDTIFSILYVFVDQKMMATFSLLFGVSMMLILDKAQGYGLRYYFVRTGWLFVFGILHLSFLFLGDVLWIYSVCALFLWIFSACSARVLIILGFLCFYSSIVATMFFQSVIDGYTHHELIELQSLWMPLAQDVVTEVMNNQLSEHSNNLFPDNEVGSINDEPFVGSVMFDYLINFIFEALSRALGMMLIGMGLYKSGFLTRLSSMNTETISSLGQRTYKAIGCLGLLSGALLASIGLWQNYANRWSAEFSVAQGEVLNDLVTPVMSIAYISLLLLWSKNSSFLQLKIALQSVGRMALSNYIFQSLIGVFLFTSVGLSMFGELSRLQLLAIVLCVWIVNLLFSVIWMRYFFFGPLEWLWRCLTKRQWLMIYK